MADPQTPAEVLNYFISSDNLRPKLLPALLENPSIREEQIAKLANSVLRDIIEIMLKSPRVRSSRVVVAALKSNPTLKREEAAELDHLVAATSPGLAPAADAGSPGSESARITDAAFRNRRAPKNPILRRQSRSELRSGRRKRIRLL